MKKKQSIQNTYISDTKNFIPEIFLNNLRVQLHNFACENIQLVNDQFNKFIDVFVRTLNKHAPMNLASKKRKKKLKTKPWITKGTLNSSKTKTELHKLSLNGTTEKLTHLKEPSKQSCFKNIINTSKYDTKLL